MNVGSPRSGGSNGDRRTRSSATGGGHRVPPSLASLTEPRAGAKFLWHDPIGGCGGRLNPRFEKKVSWRTSPVAISRTELLRDPCTIFLEESSCCRLGSILPHAWRTALPPSRPLGDA
jgi:hypothetical protein